MVAFVIDIVATVDVFDFVASLLHYAILLLLLLLLLLMLLFDDDDDAVDFIDVIVALPSLLCSL